MHEITWLTELLLGPVGEAVIANDLIAAYRFISLTFRGRVFFVANVAKHFYNYLYNLKF